MYSFMSSYIQLLFLGSFNLRNLQFTLLRSHMFRDNEIRQMIREVSSCLQKFKDYYWYQINIVFSAFVENVNLLIQCKKYISNI